MNVYTPIIPQGWQCPSCKRIYAPNWNECVHCAPPAMVFQPFSQVQDCNCAPGTVCGSTNCPRKPYTVTTTQS